MFRPAPVVNDSADDSNEKRHSRRAEPEVVQNENMLISQKCSSIALFLLSYECDFNFVNASSRMIVSM